MRKSIAVIAIVLAGLGMSSTAFAGEVNGSGTNGNGPLEERTGAYTNSNSECAFSGLEDGSEGGPAGPGNPPQNWGQIPKEFRPADFSPAVGCNGNLFGRK